MGDASNVGDEGEFLLRARAYWVARNSTLTVVRRLLCEVIEDMGRAFNVDELHAAAKRLDPAISISTVYRNLAALVQADLLRTIEGHDGKMLYETSLNHSTGAGHIICRDCGKVIPLDTPCMVVRETAAARAQGFSPEKITLRLEASCDELANTGECKQRN